MLTYSTSISALNQLKIYIRSTVDEEQLSGLALMNVHSDISFDMEELINMFAMKHPRRIKLNVTQSAKTQHNGVCWTFQYKAIIKLGAKMDFIKNLCFYRTITRLW